MKLKFGFNVFIDSYFSWGSCFSFSKEVIGGSCCVFNFFITKNGSGFPRFGFVSLFLGTTILNFSGIGISFKTEKISYLTDKQT